MEWKVLKQFTENGQVWIDPVSVTCIPGAATETTCKILVITLNDPSVNPVTLSVEGIGSFNSDTDFTEAMEAVNQDSSPNGVVAWSGMVKVTGLSSLTRYNWAVSQTVSGVVNTDSGSLCSAPAPGDDFRIVFASCDSTAFAPINGQEGAHYGAWKEYHRLANDGGPEVSALFYVDDYGYVDFASITDAGGNTGLDFDTTGSAVYPKDTASITGPSPEYNYALGWVAFFGMCGGDEADMTGINGIRLWGRALERAWCRKNLNLYFQWGDHEFQNDIGFDLAVPTGLIGSNPTTMHATLGGFDGAALVVFNRLIGRIQPDLLAVSTDITPLDTQSRHWATKHGDALLIAPDFITQMVGTHPGGSIIPSGADCTTFYGNNQIDDILNICDFHAAPFNLFGLAHSIKYPAQKSAVNEWCGVGVAEFQSGCQHPMLDHAFTEYERMFTAIGGTPKSIMDNPKTNGAQGTSVIVKGDYHHGHVYKHVKPARAGDNAELFYEICVGTVNGSINFAPVSQALVDAGPDDTNNYTDIEYVGDALYNDRRYWCLTIEVFGSRPVKEMEITVKDWLFATQWRKKFGAGRGNHAYDVDANLVTNAAVRSP